VPRVHHHDELELNLVVRGKARYLVNDRRYDLRRNTMIWLFRGQAHVLLDQSADYRMWIGVFKTDVLKRLCSTPELKTLLAPDPPGRFARQLGNAAAERIAQIFAEIAGCETTDTPRHNAGLAYALLSAWHAHAQTDEVTQTFDIHPAVERAAKILQQPGEAPALNQLADEAGLSPSRLSRLFKQQTGVTLVGYRQRIAIERFLKIYGTGQRINMLAAATEAGFGSYPQFHRVFKQIMGTSPADYRRRQNAE
jgi:AraC-like DNA-binding protein